MLFVVAGLMGEELDGLYKKAYKWISPDPKMSWRPGNKSPNGGGPTHGVQKPDGGHYESFASYYIFNMDYPPQMRRTLSPPLLPTRGVENCW